MPLGAFKLNTISALLSAPSGSITATGGSVSFYSSGGKNYKVHQFTTAGAQSFVVSAVTGTPTAQLLMVGGGGAGGWSAANIPSGGGGAGGVYTNSAVAISAQTYSLTVGAGGVSTFNTVTNGGNTTGFGYTAGGGGGGGISAAGNNGNAGSTGATGQGGGGGGGYGSSGTNAGGTGTYAGGTGQIALYDYQKAGGGGGGAGANGSNGASSGTGGNGGAGIVSSITGTVTGYAGGGGGGGGTAGGGGGGAASGSTAYGAGKGTTGGTVGETASWGGSGGGGTYKSGAGNRGGDGAAGNITIAYEFSNPRTAKTGTVIGTAQIVTAASKFGGTSGYFGGSNSGVDFASHADFAFGTGDFTIEFWFYRNVVGTQHQLIEGRTAASQARPLIFISSTNYLNYYVNGANVITSSTTGETVSANTWHHCALSKVSGVTRLFLDGSQVGATYTDSVNYIQGPIRVGKIYTTSTTPCLYGYIDDLRITKGIGRYTANFSVPTAAYFNEPSTVLLCHFDGANGSTTYSDDVS